MIRQPERVNSDGNDAFYKGEKRRINRLNETLGEVELSRVEEKTLVWIAGWEDSTVENLLSVIEKLVEMKR